MFALVLLYAFTHRPVSWVAIGDSITYLNEHPEASSFQVTKGYMSRVREKLPYIQYQNQGYSGWTARRIADSIEKLGITKADVYSVFLGTNDWWQGHHTGQWKDYIGTTSDTTIYGAFRIIVNKIRSLNPKATIILITPMQRGDFVYFGNMHNNAYGSYKPKAGQTLEQVVNAINMTYDGLHPSDKGFEYIAGKLVKVMKKL